MFPLDVELTMVPELKNSSNTALIEYLRNVSINSNFDTSILQVLTEERLATHRGQMNLSKDLLQVGEIVKYNVQVNLI